MGVHAPASQGQVSGIHRKNGLGLKTFAVLSVRICQHDRPERRGGGCGLGGRYLRTKPLTRTKGDPRNAILNSVFLPKCGHRCPNMEWV